MTDRPDEDDDETEDEFVHSHTLSGGQDTSREAAHKAFTSSAHVKALILGQLALGPRIDEALEDALAPIADSTVCARRKDLEREGRVTKLRDDEGKVVKLLNRRGNRCIVWRIVEDGEVVPTTPPTPGDRKRHDEMVAAIIETLKDPDGAGSDLEQVGEPEGSEPWLWVYGNLDVGHLANVAIDTLRKARR